MNSPDTPNRFDRHLGLTEKEILDNIRMKGVTRILQTTPEETEDPDLETTSEPVEKITHVLIGERKQAVYRADIDDALGFTDEIADAVVAELESEGILSGGTEDKCPTVEETVCLSTAELAADESEVARQAELAQKLKRVRELQIADTLGKVDAVTTHTDWEDYLRSLAREQARGGDIEAGANFVLDMRKRDEAIEKWEKTTPEGPDLKPHEIPESDRINLQIDQLKKLLAQVIFHAHDVGDFIHAGANFETGPRVEIVKKNGHAVVALRHEDDKAPQRIVIPKPQTELSPKEIRRQIGQLQKKLKLVLKVEDLCEKLRNLKVGDMIVSKSGTRRKITRVDEDSVTFIRNGDKKESTMRIAEIIERHLYAFEAVISAKKPPENDRDLFKTQQL